MPDDSNFASSPVPGELAFLQLLHLSDSALPIGGMAHSFGLETLVEHGSLTVPLLENFLLSYVQEAGVLETVYCRAGYRCAVMPPNIFPVLRWLQVNDRLSARKLARESRAASGAMGQRMLLVALAMAEDSQIETALNESRRASSLIHHSAAFGLVAGAFGLDEDRAALGYLHQSVAGLISACQRLLPLGQSVAARILWNLKPAISDHAGRSLSIAPDEVSSFMPQLDWGAMEHPALRTRLFIS